MPRKPSQPKLPKALKVSPRRLLPAPSPFRSEGGARPVKAFTKGRETVPARSKEFPLREEGSVRMCVRKESAINKGKKQLRSCHVELILRNDGPALRACTDWGKEGVLIPVKDHKDAQTKSQTFCECRKGGGTAAQCATEVGASGTLGKR